MYYSLLTKKLQQKGLKALKDHFIGIYGAEGAECEVEESAEKLIITVLRCPAVRHIRKMGLAVSPLFYETTKTVNETICEGTPFQAELLEYDSETGRSVVRFSRRGS